MKFFYSIGIFILLFTGCTNTNYNLSSKVKYSKQEQNKDSNELYKEPKTQEDIKNLNNLYEIAKKSKDPEKILKIANTYLKYKDTFINAEKKAIKLYERIYKLGSLDSAAKLIAYYIYKHDLISASKLQSKVIDKLSLENLTLIYTACFESQNRKKTLEILSYIKNKGFEHPFIIKYDELQYALRTGFKKQREEKKQKLIKEIIESKNIKDMLLLAKLLYKKDLYKDSIRVYKAIFKLDNSNADAYYDLALVYKKYSYRTKNKKQIQELAIPYLIKASKLNHEKASKDLLKYYSYDVKFLDEYFELKSKLLKSDQGKMILAHHYAKNSYYLKAFELFNEEALKGNNEAIIYLASLRANKYSFAPEQYVLNKKWKDYILNSEDIQLKEDYIKGQYRYSHKKDVKEFNEKLIKQIDKKYDSLTNIIKLREIASKYKYKAAKKAIKYYKKAADLGDVFSKRKLAALYLGKENDKTISILRDLIKQGDYESGMLLAQYYRYGSKGFKKDIGKAIEIYEIYAKKDDIKCMDQLVRLYVCGSCRENKFLNYDKGFYYTQKLVKLRGSKYDYSTLGWLYNIGKGVKRDLQKAKRYYLKAVELGNYEMYYYLAWLYYKEKANDPVIKVDYKESRYYLELGSKHNSRNSTYLLGLFYEKGLGVKKDINKAKEFYKKSNLEQAKEALKKLEGKAS